MKEYPYFIYPLLKELPSVTDPSRKRQIEEIISANIDDRDALAALIGNKEADMRNFYPDENPQRTSTEDTIDSFIAKFSPSTTVPTDKHVEPQRGREETEPSSDPLATVKILVKNREYGKALEIMEGIYLNNPKKSIYFADQIRFIRKMMLNDSKKQ